MPRRRAFFLISSFVALALIGAAACSDDGSMKGATDPPDSSANDVVFGSTDGPPSDGQTDLGPGDVCGSSAGLQPEALWPLRGGCPTRCGRTSQKGPQEMTLAFHSTSAIGKSSVAVTSQSLVWAGSEDGAVLGFDGTGRILWAAQTGGPIDSSPAIALNGAAIVGSEDGKLYAVSPGDGSGVVGDSGLPAARIVFALDIGATDSSPVIGSDGKIYIGTNAGKLVAVDAAGSHVVWSVTTGDTGGSSPAIAQDGSIHVGSTDHHLYAVTPAGVVAWSLDLGAEIHGSVAIGGEGTSYVGTSDGKLHAIDVAGKERWATSVGGDVKGTPAVYAANVYVGSSDKQLHALSTTDGHERWAYATLGEVATPVIASDGTIYVGSTDARVYAINAGGRLLASVVVKGKTFGAPAVTGGVLYVATDTGLSSVAP